MSSLRVSYVINDAAFFVSHRLQLALKVIEMGGEVCLIIGKNINKEIENEAIRELNKKNIKYYQCKFSQGIKNPILELIGLFQLIIILIKFNPTTIHSASSKANLMASIACNFLKKTKLILSISGLGTIFTGKVSFKKNLIQKIYKLLFRISLKSINYEIIFQNSDDYNVFKTIINFDKDKAKIICGSGIDTKKLKPICKKTNNQKILLPARMIYEKGIKEFVEASKLLKKRKIKVDFYLAGAIGSLNPSSIKKNIIDNWVKDGLVIYLGHQTDLNKMYEDIDIVCLPSWREGFPKVLIEAASLGLPVITTDVPGCRDVVINYKTGLIVPVQNSNKLAEAIKKLFENSKLRKKMGEKNRLLAEKKFDIEIIVPQIVNLYK
tara:strand:- start:5134 stop:6273 length:1140 start_codon:yes stop_codon:yes gene_type:complete